MSLKDTLMQDLKEAMRAGAADRVSVLRLINSGLKNRAIEKKTKGQSEELRDEDVMEVIQKEAKKRRESIEVFTKGGRPELASKEQAELSMIEAYLPKQLTREEAIAVIDQVLAKVPDKSNVGLVMKAVMAELKGKADTKMVSEIVKTKLG